MTDLNIYIIRHGKTIWNTEKKFQGNLDSPLTEQGIEEAIKTNKLVKDLNIDSVFTSPLGRTIQTKDLLIQDVDVPIHILDDLKEMNFGILEGMNIEKATENYPNVISDLWKDPLNYYLESGENYESLFKRVKNALDHIIESKYKKPLIVTHGMVVGAILGLVDGGCPSNVWKRPIVKNTSLTSLEVKNGIINIVDYDNIDHLK